MGMSSHVIVSLVEGRNTGIPTALKGIENNGSPLPKFITDEDRTFFSVIVPIHESFLTPLQKEVIKPIKSRRTKSEIKQLILAYLDDSNYSATSLYQKMGYSGNISKTFRQCVDELITESRISYIESSLNSSNNLLTKNNKL